jgi:alkylated DNA nucleotide flippase Atl1
LYGVSSSWIENGRAPELLACFPDLVAAIREFSPRVKAAITATEQNQKAAQEAASAKQKDDIAQAKLPINILGTAYASYVDVKRCQEAPDGYSTIYISIPEMNQARDAVRQIEQTMRSKLDQNTTTDDVWSRVATTEGRNFRPSGDYQEGTRMLCRERLALLLSILREHAPELGTIKKDF